MPFVGLRMEQLCVFIEWRTASVVQVFHPFYYGALVHASDVSWHCQFALFMQEIFMVQPSDLKWRHFSSKWMNFRRSTRKIWSTTKCWTPPSLWWCESTLPSAQVGFRRRRRRRCGLWFCSGRTDVIQSTSIVAAITPQTNNVLWFHLIARVALTRYVNILLTFLRCVSVVMVWCDCLALSLMSCAIVYGVLKFLCQHRDLGPIAMRVELHWERHCKVSYWLMLDWLSKCTEAINAIPLLDSVWHTAATPCTQMAG